MVRTLEYGPLNEPITAHVAPERNDKFDYNYAIFYCLERIKEAEDTFASREKDYEAQIEEYRQFEQKARNRMREKENLLEQTTYERENYKAQLSGNDGRISALESQISRIEAAKNDCEFKLSSLYSVLRRSLGLRSQSQSSTSSDEDSPKRNKSSYRELTRSDSGKTHPTFVKLSQPFISENQCTAFATSNKVS